MAGHNPSSQKLTVDEAKQALREKRVDWSAFGRGQHPLVLEASAFAAGLLLGSRRGRHFLFSTLQWLACRHDDRSRRKAGTR